jgi:hypothetical protein
MPMGIISFLSFMSRDEFILLCNGKTKAGRKQKCMFTRKLEKIGLKLYYHGSKGHSANKKQFCSNNHQTNPVEGAALNLPPRLARLEPCKAKLTSKTTFSKLNFASKSFQIL